ncbi:MAG: hypothetical protein A2252_01095 [Elusimicrobia bacterium RIFOXYA2_FULL_39_19]|nr:MAG: hypothetical protein A2252_01095 [Elusimicrobia bacterium RIFOXYA2_FULL_39_19]
MGPAAKIVLKFKVNAKTNKQILFFNIIAPPNRAFFIKAEPVIGSAFIYNYYNAKRSKQLQHSVKSLSNVPDYFITITS